MAELKCDSEVFEKGVSLGAFDARTKDMEPWVQKVAAESGQRVDWHYSGGVAHMLVLGDFQKARETAEKLLPELNGRLMRWYSGEGEGLYRAGVTPLPDGVIAVDSTS